MDGDALANLLGVLAVAFAAPLLLGFFPRVRIPSVVLELVAGIVLGPAVLELMHVDEVVEFLSAFGLAFLLFLAGLELDFGAMRGRVARLASVAWVSSFVLAVGVGSLVEAADLIGSALFVAAALSATGLGIVLPILKDAGRESSPFGRLVLANASIAEFVTIVLLATFFSTGGMSAGRQGLALVVVAVVAVAVVLALGRLQRSMTYARVLRMLQDTTAQIRVRAAILLMVGAVVLAETLGFEAILGAFAAGAAISLVDHGWEGDHPRFRMKLEAIGFGFVIPVFFVASGLRFDLQALTGSLSTAALVPLFLSALLLVRGLPAVAYLRELRDRREVAAAAALQATSLGFILAATEVGQALGVVRAATAAALVAAGLLSVLVFPAAAVSLLRRSAVSSSAGDA